MPKGGQRKSRKGGAFKGPTIRLAGRGIVVWGENSRPRVAIVANE